MKCELLKRTAIALFVGSIVSTYAMAEDDTTNTLKSAVSKLATGIQDNLLPAIAANRTDIDKNTSNIKELAVGIQDNILPALEANRTDIDANKAAIGELAKATDEAVTNLGNAVSGLDEDLAGTQDAVAENRKDIDALKETQTYKHLSKVENLVKDKADKTELAAKADKTELAAKADKTELANKADKNSVYSKSETDNKFALKADNSVVSAQAADINNLRTDVNAHKVDIDKLRTDVNTHTKRLDHLDNRVNKLDKDLKRGLASQAALTGLFQPYTVGKANFTAAVGGYKSQTAVAVGTGYRYNQNIATKAGVAFTQGGGVTYNAGVNFEW